MFEKEYNLEWHGQRLRMFSAKGHSDDGLIVNFNDEVLFTGDTLLNIPTITRFQTGNTDAFWNVDIPNILKCGIDRALPGHGNEGNVKEMIKTNTMAKNRCKRNCVKYDYKKVKWTSTNDNRGHV